MLPLGISPFFNVNHKKDINYSKSNIIPYNAPVHDKFITSGRVSFGAGLKDAIKYTKQVEKYYAARGEKLNSLYQLDPKRMEGILDGIDVFKNFSVKDFYLLSQVSDVLTQRGCPSACSHCFIDAGPLAKDKQGHDVSTIKWDDFKKLTEGIGEVKKRLGFNPFSYENHFFPFLDSDPVTLKSIDKNGKSHNIAEASKLFYDKTGIPFWLTTSGWDKHEIMEQKAMNELVNNVVKNPDSLKKLVISLHPFHHYMTSSNGFKRTANSLRLEAANDRAVGQVKTAVEKEKQALEKIIKSAQYRQKYVDRMTNVLITDLPLLKLKKSGISVQSAPEAKKSSGVTFKDAEELAKEVLLNVEKECKKRGMHKEDYEFLTSELDIRKNPYVFLSKEIYAAGRGRLLFDQKDNDVKFILKKTASSFEINTEALELHDQWNKEVAKNIVDNVLKNNDFLDKVNINVTGVKNRYLLHADRISTDTSKLEHVASTQSLKILKGKKGKTYRENYVDMMASTLNVYLPLFKLDKAKVNLLHSDSLSSEELKKLSTDILTKLEALCKAEGMHEKEYSFLTQNKDAASNKHFTVRKFTEEDDLNKTEKTGTKNQANIVGEIFSNIKPDYHWDFAREIQKAIGSNGEVYLKSGDRGAFNFHFAQIDGLQLNFEDKNKPLPNSKNNHQVVINKDSIKAPDFILKRDKEIFADSKHKKGDSFTFKGRFEAVA